MVINFKAHRQTSCRSSYISEAIKYFLQFGKKNQGRNEIEMFVILRYLMQTTI